MLSPCHVVLVSLLRAAYELQSPGEPLILQLVRQSAVEREREMEKGRGNQRKCRHNACTDISLTAPQPRSLPPWDGPGTCSAGENEQQLGQQREKLEKLEHLPRRELLISHAVECVSCFSLL